MLHSIERIVGVEISAMGTAAASRNVTDIQRDIDRVCERAAENQLRDIGWSSRIANDCDSELARLRGELLNHPLHKHAEDLFIALARITPEIRKMAMDLIASDAGGEDRDLGENWMLFVDSAEAAIASATGPAEDEEGGAA